MINSVSALQGVVASQPSLPTAAKSSIASAGIDPSFTDALAQASNQVMSSLRKAEELSLRGLEGGVETREVVDAVMSAEQSLQAAIAIRDKIVAAFLDVSRMQI